MSKLTIGIGIGGNTSAPFTAEQIAWLDERYRMSVPAIMKSLEQQGKEAPKSDETP